MQVMFPSASKEKEHHKLLLMNSSPKNMRDNNKSTYLPYFKRFPHHKFLSQERKRPGQEDQEPIKSRKFFTQEKQSSINDHDAQSLAKIFSSSILKDAKSVGKVRQPRLIKQYYERETNNRMKRSSDQSLGEKNNRLAVNSSFNVHSSSAYLTPGQVLRLNHNLNEAEVEEILKYEEVYYYGQNCLKKYGSGREKSPSLLKSPKEKDSEEGYQWVKGDHIAYRYQIVDILGEGSFGQVYRCLDYKNAKDPIALKIVKNNQKYLNQAKIQIKILNFIKAKDTLSTKNCIEIKDSFSFRNRICMTFNLMAMNLYELIKSNGYYGLPMDLIRRFVLQILNGIHYLHKNRIIHADLKPQNILLKQANKSGIKIIDFGSSCFENETIYTYIQSRYYRGPQVILGLPYDRKIDIWSFGCIIAELHLGFPLFGGENEHEQMCFIIEVMGMPPKELASNSKRWHVFFDSNHNLKPHQKKVLPASKTLKKALEGADDDFVEFIRLCLEWTPEKRIEALELLKHEWVLRELPNDFREQHLKFIRDEEDQGMEEQSNVKKSRKHTFSIRERHKIVK